MPGVLAVIELSFDPTLRLGDLQIRWQTIGVTVAILVALSIAAMSLSRPLLEHSPASTGSDEHPLRMEDMVLIVAGAVPGAVVGGRLMHALTYAEAYAAAPLSVLDPGAGSLSLLGAVVGGALGGAYLARLVGTPLHRWADVAAVPLLVAIGLGKLAQLLGGSGQGLPFDGAWAVAFAGAGPWVSAAADVPSHPAQIYEALWMLVGIPIVLMLTGPRRRSARLGRRIAWADREVRPGGLFVNAVAWFLAGRFIVGLTWRDPAAIGPLNLEQVAALLLLGAITIGPRWRRASRRQ